MELQYINLMMIQEEAGGWYGGSIQRDNYSGGGSNWVYTESTYNNWASNSTEGRSGNWKLSSEYYLSDAQKFSGNQQFTSPTGTNETGHSGNGYARITALD